MIVLAVFGAVDKPFAAGMLVCFLQIYFSITVDL